MSFDVINALYTAGGGDQKPFEVEGVFVEPPVFTRSSQATGAAGATVLVAAYTGGRIKMRGKVVDVAGAETTIVSQNGYLTSGQGVWFTLVAVQHKVSGGISLRWIPGTVATLALAEVPTFDEIVAYLGLDDSAAVVILGDLRFSRPSDLVITHAARDVRRPSYVDDGEKTGLLYDESSQTNMAEVWGGFVDLQIGLVQMSGVAAGSLYIDGAALPKWPFGGKIKSFEYIPAVNGTGAGATQDLIPNIDGTPVTGGVLTLTLANAVVPTPVASTAITAANSFWTGKTLDIEVDNAGTDFTAGSGTLRIGLSKFVRR